MSGHRHHRESSKRLDLRLQTCGRRARMAGCYATAGDTPRLQGLLRWQKPLGFGTSGSRRGREGVAQEEERGDDTQRAGKMKTHKLEDTLRLLKRLLQC